MTALGFGGRLLVGRPLGDGHIGGALDAYHLRVPRACALQVVFLPVLEVLH